MKEVSMTAARRDDTGKSGARRARREGNIPGVVYGPETEPVSIAVSEREFRAAVKAGGGQSAIFNLAVDGKESKVIVRELQRDPLTSKVVHVDFHAISMNKPIHISVPIHLRGTPEGVKTDGGIMQTTLRELNISCLPTDIPEAVNIDVSELHIGESIHVRDIDLPNVQILDELQRTIVVISAPTIVKATVVEGEEAAAEGAVEGAEETSEEEKGEEAKDEESK